MFYGDKVQDTRPVFFISWQKQRAGQILTPLEQQIVHVIACHPEYHEFFEQPLASLSMDYAAMEYASSEAENPFLHLGLHLALREQVATNRPLGVAGVFQRVVGKYGDPLEAEHQVMAVLSEWLWRAQQTGTFSDDGYLAALTRL